MQLNMQQLKQIIKYNPGRMYFGNWNQIILDTMANSKPSQTIHIGDLTNNIICNTLWYEMSYNPRYGDISPFKTGGKNDIIYFNNNYRKTLFYKTRDLLPDEIMNLTCSISDFIKHLNISDLYSQFAITRQLPQTLKISGTNHYYYVLNSLNRAVNAIANQNWQDITNQMYAEHIIQTATNRHPTGKRSDVNYMFINLEFEKKHNRTQSNSRLDVTDTVLSIINENLAETKRTIINLNQQIEDMEEIENTDTLELQHMLKRAQLQHTELCIQRQKWINNKQNPGRY